MSRISIILRAQKSQTQLQHIFGRAKQYDGIPRIFMCNAGFAHIFRPLAPMRCAHPERMNKFKFRCWIYGSVCTDTSGTMFENHLIPSIRRISGNAFSGNFCSFAHTFNSIPLAHSTPVVVGNVHRFDCIQLIRPMARTNTHSQSHFHSSQHANCICQTRPCSLQPNKSSHQQISVWNWIFPAHNGHDKLKWALKRPPFN